MKTEILKKLEKIAEDRTIPFCMSCHIKAPKGICPSCFSDDLMRHLDGVGVEWGTSWVIKHILQEEFTPVDTDEAFESSLEDCYPEETEIGFMRVNTIEAMKDLDPTWWEMAKSEYIDSLIEDGSIVEVGGNYYWDYDLEAL